MSKIVLLSFFFLILSIEKSDAQNYTSDFNLVLNQYVSQPVKKEKASFIEYTPPFWIYKFAEKKIKPQIGIGERYEVKLREFTKLSFKEFGLVKGYFISIDRINRTGRLGYIDFPKVRLTPQGSINDLPKYYKMK